MRSVLLVGGAVAIVACGSSGSTIGSSGKPSVDAGTGGSTGGRSGGCASDIECKGARICQSGVCVEPPGTGGRSPSTGSGGIPGSGGTLGAGGGAPLGGFGGGIVFGRGGADASVPTDSGISSGGATGCLAIRQVPESIVVYRDATVTDTVVTNKPVALFFMVDRSTSMVTGLPSGSTRDWSDTAAGISAFVNDPSSMGVDVGLGTFPYGPSNTASCDGSDCGTPVVPIASLPGNAAAMSQAMTAQTPSVSPIALRPTECGLRGMINDCLQYMAVSATGEQCVGVLITDGAPTQCDTTQADLTQIVADGHSKGVTTYVLGLLGADLGALNSLALAGGTNAALDVSGGTQTIIRALNYIRSTVAVTTQTIVTTPVTVAATVPCEWRIPPAPPSGFDPNKVNLEYTPAGGPPRIFGRVASSSDCSAVNGDAWYYDDIASPTRILLCPRACSDIGSSAGAAVSLLFGCATVLAH